ncbi:hypothetical protein SAMN05216571_10953 [Onishia taeanensis]|uniref:Uncharacterized protein n=1 Tax=Onishia taeanensis TaxID=284577 RepID=A0A1G7T7D2_9GAMM|nr:hypothetical protein SAMN05216571_10953 [Halomonas taeanensis]
MIPIFRRKRPRSLNRERGLDRSGKKPTYGFMSSKNFFTPSKKLVFFGE